MQIQCPNPDCRHLNPSQEQQCAQCHTPLAHRYLWAADPIAARVPDGKTVASRYRVISPRLWLDTQPALAASAPSPLPDGALPYLHLDAHRLHLPQLDSFYVHKNGVPTIPLLTNIPVDAAGQLFPTLKESWTSGSAVRQVYWLWQILELWQPLQAQGVAQSLLHSDNLRIEGWRVRLLELLPDTQALSLSDLAAAWLTWIEESHPAVVDPLRDLCQQMQAAAELADPTDQPESQLAEISRRLNRLLLEQAAQLPLNVQLAGGTTTGPQRAHNEDACYPDAAQPSDQDSLLPYVGIVCDGIGGHEGGEVASQLALRSLQVPLRALLTELIIESEPLEPAIVEQQLLGIVRIVNNLIAEQNDLQKRELRQRMGTTLVLALQLPQQVETPAGLRNAHELYLVHVGDSRAYWLTPHYCQCLTVDDDVVGREVRLGRSLYRDALTRTDAAALTQALGTREAEALHPTVQRFILEENGILLLCSDGLSDRNRVEEFWAEQTRQVFNGNQSLEAAVQSWLELANQQNGHDNTSVVLMRCMVSAAPQLFDPLPDTSELPAVPEPELTESSRRLLYDEAPEPISAPSPAPAKLQRSSWVTVLVVAAMMFAAGAMSMALWKMADPLGFQQTWEKITGAPAAPSP